MSLAGLGMLLVSANMAIHVDGIDNVTRKTLGKVVVALRKQVKAKTGEKAKIDKKAGKCRSDPACVKAVTERTGATDILFIGVAKPDGKKGKPAKIKVKVDLYRGEDGTFASSKTVLPADKAKWKKRLKRLISKVFAKKGKSAKPPPPPPPPPVARAPGSLPVPTRQDPPKVDPPKVEPEKMAKAEAKKMEPAKEEMAKTGEDAKEEMAEKVADDSMAKTPMAKDGPTAQTLTTDGPEPVEIKLLPWSIIATSVVVAGLGGYFAVNSGTARADAEEQAFNPTALEPLNDRLVSNGLAANILFGTAIAGVATGVTLLFLD